jgi:hypothetical protein
VFSLEPQGIVGPPTTIATNAYRLERILLPTPPTPNWIVNDIKIGNVSMTSGRIRLCRDCGESLQRRRRNGDPSRDPRERSTERSRERRSGFEMLL